MAGGEFGFDQGAQHFFLGPPLRLRGQDNFGCGATDRGEFESSPSGIEIG
ncbi:hypothetical protein [Rhodococcus qingshengii]|nr:hypothetical protein [Rhodococcus qingshengii]